MTDDRAKPGVADALLAYDDAVIVRACLHAVARFGVADLVGDGTANVSDVARSLKLDHDGLRRIVSALAEHGIFRVGSDGDFWNTPSSSLLRTDAPGSLRSHFGSSGPALFAPELSSVLREGRSAVEVRYGVGFWEYLDARHEEMRFFQEKMAEQLAYLHLDHMARLEWGERILDIGGGLGTLLARVVESTHGRSGSVLELGSVVRLAKSVGAGAGARVEFLPGDMFVNVPQPYDWLLLARVLHDWDDESAAKLLSVAHADSGPATRLRLVERILDPEVGEDDGRGAYRNVAMLLLFGGGHERTRSDLERLLLDNGWLVFARHYVGRGHVALDCEKV